MVILPSIDIVEHEPINWDVIIALCIGALFGFMIKWYYKKGKEEGKKNE